MSYRRELDALQLRLDVVSYDVRLLLGNPKFECGHQSENDGTLASLALVDRAISK